MIRVHFALATDKKTMATMDLPFVPRREESVYLSGQPYRVADVSHYLHDGDYVTTVMLTPAAR